MKNHKSALAAVAASFILVGSVPVVSQGAGEAWFTLSQFSGAPGVTIQVWGGGFMPEEAIQISGPGAVPVQATSTSWGMIDPPVSFTVPIGAAQGHFEITATGLTSGRTGSNAYYVQPFAASLSLSAGAATPGGSVAVSGSGFGSEVVRVSLASSSIATTTSAGGFSGLSLPIPFVAAGTYEVMAEGESSGARAVGYLYVNGLYPSISPSTYYVLPGESLTFAGTGFAPREAVRFSIVGSTTTLGTAAADQSGNFSDGGSFRIPFGYAGEVKTFRAQGESSGVAAEVMVAIGRLYPSVSPSAYWLLPGNVLSFSGSGFGGSEQVRLFDGAGTSSILMTQATAGSFMNASFTVPYSMSGSTRNFRFVGEESGAEGSVSVTVGGLYPTLQPSAYFVLMGYPFTLSGTGFAPGEQISFTLGTATSAIAASANEFGNFFLAGPFRAPTGQVGPVPALATGLTSGARAEAMLTIGSLYPSVSPTDYYLMPAQNLEFRGSGFVPEETVDVLLGTSTIASVQTNGFGSFTKSVIAPTRAGGVQYSFVGRLSGAVATLNLFVAGTFPVVTAENYYVAPGDGTFVRGTNFVANEAVTVQLNGTFHATTTANGIGNTPFVPVVMPIATGTVAISMTGAVSGGAGATTITLIPFSPQVTPSTWWAPAGTNLSFTGTGFAPAEEITLIANGTSTATTTASASGTFSWGGFRLPNGAPARYEFKGSLSGTSVMVEVGVGMLSPWMFMDAYYGPGGAPIVISGRGFAQGEEVSLSWGGMAFATTTASGGGTFDLSTQVPFSTPGNKEVRGTGAWSGAVGTTGFTQAQVFVNLELGAYAVTRGGPVQFIGSGYLPNEPVEIRTDRTGETVVHLITAGASGSFNDSGYIIPADFAEGPLTLTAIGTHSLESRSITIYVGL